MSSAAARLGTVALIYQALERILRHDSPRAQRK